MHGGSFARGDKVFGVKVKHSDKFKLAEISNLHIINNDQ